jgi:hypothetical protein
MFADFFAHCNFNNPVFLSGLFWGFVFIITFARVVHFKLVEAKEESVEDEIIRNFLADQQARQSTSENRK